MANRFSRTPAGGDRNIALDLLNLGSQLAMQKLNAKERKAQQRQQALRDEVQLGIPSDPNFVGPMPQGIVQRGQDLDERRIDLAEKSTQQTPVELTQFQDGDFGMIQAGFKQVDKQAGTNISKSIEPIINQMKQWNAQGYTRYDTYNALKQGWSQAKKPLLQDLQRDLEKAVMANDHAKEKAIFEMMNEVGSDTFLDSVMSASARRARIEKKKSLPKETFGNEFTDKYGNILQRSPETGKLRKISGPPKTGTTITTPDGTTVTFGGTKGGPADVPKGAKTSLFKDIVGQQQALDAIETIETLYEPEFLSYYGRGEAFLADKLNRMNPSKKSQFLARRDKFISAANKEFIRFRKWATGVAGGEKEMAEIKRATFSEDDSPQGFQSKLEIARSLSRRLIARTKAALVAGVNNEKEFKEFIKVNPLDSIPTLQERGEQLERDGHTEEQIAKILIQEGYINPAGN